MQCLGDLRLRQLQMIQLFPKLLATQALNLHLGHEPLTCTHVCAYANIHRESAFLCQSKQAQVPTKARPSLGYLCSSALQGGVGSKGGQVLILQGTRF